MSTHSWHICGKTKIGVKLLICLLMIVIFLAVTVCITMKWRTNEDQEGWTDSLRYRQIPEQKLDQTQLTYMHKNFVANDTNLLSDVTIVTMYLNIGSFQKGEFKKYTPELYQKWMKVFAFLQNPVVAFFDNEHDKEYFENLRRHVSSTLTKAILVKRSQLWAFSLMKNISEIFSKPEYPVHHPNTVVAEYSCVMHTKYEVMLMAIKENIFHTRYFAWLDIGLFRSLAESNKLSFFELWLPPNFNISTVAYTQVYKRMSLLDPKSIIYSNAVWVCGAFFIAELNVMARWSEEYIAATERLIRNYELMSTDQQVLYIMQNLGQSTSRIQTYQNPDQKDDWFYLGYLCKKQGYKRRHGLI